MLMMTSGFLLAPVILALLFAGAKGKRGADLTSDALPRALPSVAAPSEVMNCAGLFGHLGRCYRNHKAVRIRLNRAAGVLS
jgi:hypothetical protein